MSPSFPRKIGVTIGKFHPMHLGHELMIHMAALELDELTVIVSDTRKPFNGGVGFLWETRYQMMVQKLRKYPNVKVVMHHDIFGDPAQVDEHGTGIGEDFWEYWTNVFKLLAPGANYFVSSDRYGQKAAQCMSSSQNMVEWFPVDPGRELMQISATKIRNNPIKYWKYISQEFRYAYGKRVLVIGPESTGKSTLSKDLGAAWNSPVVPEYGRILSEAMTNNLNDEHFYAISRRHYAMEDFAIRNSNTGITISDTDFYTTYLFGVVYLDKFLDKLKSFSKISYDLVVLLPPTLPWDDDGTRVIPEQKERELFYDALHSKYKNHPNLLVLHETDRVKRVEEVSIAIAKIMSAHPMHSDMLPAVADKIV
jgi:HTH-type transcriptional repressor of NAD biosynthesis genes